MAHRHRRNCPECCFFSQGDSIITDAPAQLERFAKNIIDLAQAPAEYMVIML